MTSLFEYSVVSIVWREALYLEIPPGNLDAIFFLQSFNPIAKYIEQPITRIGNWININIHESSEAEWIFGSYTLFV